MSSFKLDSINITYRPGNGYYAFIKKEGDVVRLLHVPASCKDFTHETIASALHKKDVHSPLVRNAFTFEDLINKFQLVMFFAKDPHIKKTIFEAKKYISSIEKECGIPKTLVAELESDIANTSAFLFTFNKVYVESVTPSVKYSSFGKPIEYP